MSSAAGQALPVVLVIDDNPDDRLKIRWMLSRERPVAFYEAEGAVQGLALWARIKPDLVLLDLSMPDGRGEEVLRLARQHRWGDPLVIAVSELALPDRVSSLAQEGVKGFLPKDRLTQDLLSHAIEQVNERVRVRGRIVDQQARLDLACQMKQLNASTIAFIARIPAATFQALAWACRWSRKLSTFMVAKSISNPNRGRAPP